VIESYQFTHIYWVEMGDTSILLYVIYCDIKNLW